MKAPLDSSDDPNDTSRHMHESTTTHGIQVEVESRFVPERSNAEQGEFFFAYEIRITNTTSNPVRLLNRHWIITDGWGRVEEVKGPGVIGQQPWINPGESFAYESFCPLSTPTGTMSGTYEMGSTDGPANIVSVEIPQFFLVEPGSFH